MGLRAIRLRSGEAVVIRWRTVGFSVALFWFWYLAPAALAALDGL